MMALIAAWLLTVALHAAVLGAGMWVLERPLLARLTAASRAWRQAGWRVALFGAVLTATLQFALGGLAPAPRWIVQLAPQAATALPMPQTAAPSAPPAVRVATGAAVATDHAALDRLATQAPSPPAAPVSGAGDASTAVPATAATSRASWLPSLDVLLTAAWLAGVLVAFARWLGDARALRHLLAEATPVDDAALLDDADALSQFARVQKPRVLQQPALASPIAARGARIVLPAWTLTALDRPARRAMLAHEIAHLARRDPLWKHVIALWRSVFWFAPLAGVAKRRLDDIAELDCDAFAAHATGSGRDLAHCLAVCAERVEHGATPALAPAMAARRSAFVHRIDSLLEGSTDMAPISLLHRALRRAFPATLLLAGAACLPGVGLAPRAAIAQPAAPSAPAAPAVPPAPRHHVFNDSTISIHSDDDHETLSVSYDEGSTRFHVSVDGKITFNDSETDVATLSTDGRAKFEEKRDGVQRRMDLDERGGKIERRYFVDGHEQAVDAAGQAWFAHMVVQLERSGVGAEARERRLYAAGGALRVLAELDEIPTDYARTLYLKLLLAHGRLAPGEVDRAVAIAGQSGSDYERRQGLEAIFKTQVLAAPQQVAFLQQAMHFDSDYERAQLLVEVAPALVDAAPVRQAWLDAALKVKSDYERRRTLTAFLDGNGVNDTQIASVIKASDSMQSDYERRELLVEAVRRAHDVAPLVPAFAKSASGLHSDYERREALIALIRSGDIGSAGTLAVLDATGGIGSSYEKRTVLVEVARVLHPGDSAVIARYRSVADGLGDYDRREAEKALKL